MQAVQVSLESSALTCMRLELRAADDCGAAVAEDAALAAGRLVDHDHTAQQPLPLRRPVLDRLTILQQCSIQLQPLTALPAASASTCVHVLSGNAR